MEQSRGEEGPWRYDTIRKIIRQKAAKYSEEEKNRKEVNLNQRTVSKLFQKFKYYSGEGALKPLGGGLLCCRWGAAWDCGYGTLLPVPL